MRRWREVRGGHWEQWAMPEHNVHLWMRLPSCTVGSGRRPVEWCRGTPVCEDHGRASVLLRLVCAVAGHRPYIDHLGNHTPDVVQLGEVVYDRPFRRYCERCHADLPGEPQVGDRCHGLDGPWRA